MPDRYRVVGFVPRNDGRGVAIRAAAVDGTTVDIDVPLDEIGDVIAALIEVCQTVRRSAPLAAPVSGSAQSIPTVEARGIGIAAIAEAGRTGFMVDLEACCIGFSVPNERMRVLGSELARVCAAMSADESKRQ